MSQYSEAEQAAIIKALRERQEKNKYKPLVKKESKPLRKAKPKRRNKTGHSQLSRETYAQMMNHMRDL